MTFVRVVSVNGEECAEIAEEIDLRAKVTEGEDQGALELKATGTTHRSLKTGLNVEGRLTGTMSITGVKTLDG